MVSSCAGLTQEKWPSATTCPTESWWGPSRCTTTSHTLPQPAWCWRMVPPLRTSMSLSWLQDSPTGKAQTRVTLRACSPPQRGTQYWSMANSARNVSVSLLPFEWHRILSNNDIRLCVKALWASYFLACVMKWSRFWPRMWYLVDLRGECCVPLDNWPRRHMLRQSVNSEDAAFVPRIYSHRVLDLSLTNVVFIWVYNKIAL